MDRSQSTVLATIFVLFVESIIHAKDKAVYQTGKLVDVRAYATGAGALRAQYSFCLAIQVEDISYIAHCETFSRSSYQPTNLVVGDPIKVKIADEHLYFETGKKSPDEAKAHITRRERIIPESKPATCALPIAVEH
jgi:hypothetical protein